MAAEMQSYALSETVSPDQPAMALPAKAVAADSAARMASAAGPPTVTTVTTGGAAVTTVREWAAPAWGTVSHARWIVHGGMLRLPRGLIEDMSGPVVVSAVSRNVSRGPRGRRQPAMVNGVEGRGHNLGRGVPDRMAHFTIKQWGRDPHDVNNNEKDGLTPLHIAGEPAPARASARTYSFAAPPTTTTTTTRAAPSAPTTPTLTRTRVARPPRNAAEMGFLDMGVWLMQHGARESLSLGDALGRTPLFKAVWYGHEDMANWVSSAAFGGDPSAMMAG